MTNATHTPGSWTACKPGYGWQIRGQDDGSGPDASRFGAYVAECYANAQEADARLIAAAPDLLQALENAVFAMESAIILRGLDDLAPYADVAHKAINKAKGN